MLYHIQVSINMADTGTDDRVQKMEVDCSSTVDEKVPKCEKLAKVNQTRKFDIWCFIFPMDNFSNSFRMQKVSGHSNAF